MLRALLLISAAVFTFWSVWYVRKSGVLRAYPDTSFMTKPNEELRVMYQNLSEKEKAVYTALYEEGSEKDNFCSYLIDNINATLFHLEALYEGEPKDVCDDILETINDMFKDELE